MTAISAAGIQKETFLPAARERREPAAAITETGMTHTDDNGPDGSGYFLYHSIGMFPDKERRIAAALSRFAGLWSRLDDSQWPAALALRSAFIEHWRRLINAPEHTVATAENVTTALYSLLGGLPPHYLQGRRVLVAGDCFPSLHFLMAGMAERHGFELDTVGLAGGSNWVTDDDFLNRWQEDVGVALITAVTSTASFRPDLARLAAHGRRMGSLVGLDITQGAGLIPFDVRSPEADFVVSTSLKWLGGTPGAGMLYVNERLLPDCRPELRGWFSQPNPFSWDLDGFEYAPDARRFDHGTPSIVASAGTLAALEWHAGEDPGRLLAHNRRLSRAIIEGADRLGLDLASPRDDESRGGSVMLRIPASRNAADIVDALRTAEVYTDHRGPILRLSPGCVTTMEGVQRLLGELESLLA